MRRSVLAAALSIFLLATPGMPQIVAGRVVDVSTDLPIEGVLIALVDTVNETQATVISNTAGEFIIVIAAPGTYLLRASRLGYATAQTRPIEIGADEAVEVELRLDVEAVELEPLTVVVRRRESVRERDLREYYERIERYGRPRLGPIRIRAREDLEGWDPYTVKDVLRVYSPRFRSFGEACAPRVFLDGFPMPGVSQEFVWEIPVSNIEGIEFYSGVGAPGTRFWDPDGCGTILAWTRPLTERRPFGFTKLLGAAGAILLTALVTWLVF